MRILIIEDEPGLGQALKYNFEDEAYAVDLETDGDQGVYRAKTNYFDLIVLDDILAGKRGYEICKALRRNGKSAPILFISVESGIDRKVSLLNDGADDYLTKPFSFEEMSARVRALLRRPRELAREELRIGDFVLDETAGCAFFRGKQIYLTGKEFSLLRYLMKNAGRVVTRSMIMEHVWDGATDPFSNIIEAHMHNLREKIGEAGGKEMIKTIPGRGYIFKAEPFFRHDLQMP